MVEKLDPAFKRCNQCGELFFRSDGKVTKIGFLCNLCIGKGLGVGCR